MLKLPSLLEILSRTCLTHSSFGEAYGNDGARGRSSHSRSPYPNNSYNSYDAHGQGRGGYRMDGWDAERRGSDMQSGRKFEYPVFPQTLEDLEFEYKREAVELGKIRDKEEDEENFKHREVRLLIF